MAGSFGGSFGRMNEYFQRRIWNSRLLNGFCPVSKMVLFSYNIFIFF
jgi:hypothetical protein